MIKKPDVIEQNNRVPGVGPSPVSRGSPAGSREVGEEHRKGSYPMFRRSFIPKVLCSELFPPNPLVAVVVELDKENQGVEKRVKKLKI